MSRRSVVGHVPTFSTPLRSVWYPAMNRHTRPSIGNSRMPVLERQLPVRGVTYPAGRHGPPTAHRRHSPGRSCSHVPVGDLALHVRGLPRQNRPCPYRMDIELTPQLTALMVRGRLVEVARSVHL